MEWLFGIFFVFFIATFAFVFYNIISTTVKQKRINATSPTLTVDARAISKRVNVRGKHSYTSYYITFEFESGDRLELHVPAESYGYIIEGDRGRLTFKGNEFVSFDRAINS